MSSIGLIEKSTEQLVPFHQPESQTKKPLLWKDWMLLFILTYQQFCLAACVSLQAPFFPHEAEMKGVSATVYGLVFGVFELTIIIFSPVFGKLMFWITPKFLVTSGVFIAGSCSILFGVLDKAPSGIPFISLAFACRIVEGLGTAAVITTSYTIVSAHFPGTVAKAFSALETFFGLGLIAGPTIGGILYEVKGFFLPFLVMGMLMLIGSVLCFSFLPESADVTARESGSMSKYLLNVGVLLDSIAVITSLTFIGFNSATLEPHLRRFSLSPSLIGLVFVITGTTYAATTPIWGWLCDKGVNPKLLCILGYILQCINLMFIGPLPFFHLQTKLWLIITSLIIGGLGMACKVVCAFISALQETKKRGLPNDMTTHAMVSAMFASSCSIGAFIGPSMGGFLLDRVGFKTSTAILLALEIIFMILTIVYCIFKQQKKTDKLNEESKHLLENET